jgi:hypothetical protein
MIKKMVNFIFEAPEASGAEFKIRCGFCLFLSRQKEETKGLKPSSSHPGIQLLKFSRSQHRWREFIL